MTQSKRYIAPAVIGLLGAAILAWLGSWQIQRLDWKRAILTEINTTIAGEPQALPVMIDPTTQRYLPLDLTGTIEPEALYVLVSVKLEGPGWRAISALQTDDGRRILVDRGFLPVDQKSTALYAGPIEVQGNLLWPDDRTSSTPANDEAKNVWFARDIAPMAEALNTEPLMVIARQVTPPDAAVRPLPVDTSGIPNDHLQYAITWFSLGLIWLLMTGVWMRRIAKGTD